MDVASLVRQQALVFWLNDFVFVPLLTLLLMYSIAERNSPATS
jgi:hypothetical protein